MVLVVYKRRTARKPWILVDVVDSFENGLFKKDIILKEELKKGFPNTQLIIQAFPSEDAAPEILYKVEEEHRALN